MARHAPALKDHNVPSVDLAMAALFFEQVCDAHRAGDAIKFEAARMVLMMTLGLSTSR